jgi:hypothetical protein
MEMLTGNGYPSKHLKGEVGQHYRDLETGDIFECVSANKHSRINLHQTGGYIWKKGVHGDHAEAVGGASVQPDWNQNDETKPDYVKNRTHWVEAGLEEIMPENSCTTEYVPPMDKYCAYLEISAETAQKFGDVVTIVFDGVEYECVRNAHGNNLYYGNMSPFEDDVDTGEPLAMIVFASQGYSTLYVLTDTTPTTHTIACYKKEETVHTIDPKFLPDGGSGGAFVVTVIVNNDGGYTADKTYAELDAAYQESRVIRCRLEGAANVFIEYNLSQAALGQGYGFSYFTCIPHNSTYMLSILMFSADGTISEQTSMFKPTANEA